MLDTTDSHSDERPTIRVSVDDLAFPRTLAPTAWTRRRLILKQLKSTGQRDSLPRIVFRGGGAREPATTVGLGGRLRGSTVPSPGRARIVALVVDDHALFRAGLAAMLRRDCGCAEVLEASDMDGAMATLSARPDITLGTFDSAMPVLSSLRDIVRVRHTFPRLRVAVVTDASQREEILLALSAGAHGYILKEWSSQRISEAICCVLMGIVSVPSTIADIGTPPMETLQHAPCVPLLQSPRTDRLSTRQAEVLRLITAGNSNKEIARRLGLSEHTVKIHASALYRVIGVRNRVAAAVFAEEHAGG